MTDCAFCNRPRNTRPQAGDKCFDAFCSKCRRHRIDTSSVGRHMVEINWKPTCHDCAPASVVSALGENR